jgi:hypothetical protein
MLRPCALLALVFLVSALSPGPGPADEKQAGVPADIKDAAFERYVDLAELRGAILDLDSARLCDVALGLANGERVLLRSHKGLPSSRVFQLALEAAAEKRDKATLARLVKIFESNKNAEMAKRAKQAIALAGPGRKVDPSLLVSADSMSAEALALYRSFLEQINTAKALRDRATLEDLDQSVSALPELGAKQRSALRGRIKDALDSLPAAKGKAKKAVAEDDEDEDALLRKLAASARGAKSYGDLKSKLQRGKEK